MKLRLPSLIFLLIGLLGTTPAFVQEKDRLDDSGELLGWEGVGRLDLGVGSCTGALIARDIVLTAAHCVVDDRTGQVLPLRQMRFHAGYTHGQTAASRGIAKIVVANGYSPDDATPIALQVSTDLALLKLDNEIFSAEAEPFKVHDRPVDGSQVTLVSYGRGRSEALQRESGCRHIQTFNLGIMTFDCDVTFGSSGAPVFTREDGRLRIFSVISMMAERDGRKEAVGMSLPQTVDVMMRSLRAETSTVPVTKGAKRVVVGQRSAGGARFVKPGG